MAVNKTSNEELLEALLRHQIFLLRYAGSIRNKIIKLLEATEQDITDQIAAKAATGRITPAALRRIEFLRKAVSKIRLKAWADVNDVWAQDLVALAQQEAEFVSAILKTVSPVEISFVLPAPRQLRFIALSKPFEGKVLKEWAKRTAATDLERIGDQLKIGLVRGETGPSIARRVRRAMDLSKFNAETITRTAISAIANDTRQEFFNANKQFFEKELFVATLDSRTTPICRSLDGKVFKVGEGPIPPLHMNCRSIRVAALFDEAIGSRPYRAFTKKQILEEFAEREGLSRVPKNRDALPRGLKGKFDEFARKRIRELTGQVPAKLTYQEWLSRQSAAMQDDILGKTRGRLFRRGGLTLDQFVDRQGQEIPLSELAKRERAAFVAAGLHPEDFYD